MQSGRDWQQPQQAHRPAPARQVAIARARAPAGPSVNKRGAHEAALRKWLEALEAANAQLHALGREGHVNTLRQQVGAGLCIWRRPSWRGSN